MLSCGGASQEPPPPPPSSSFTLDQQTVGKPADGLTLRSIRHAPHPGFYRIVFDIGMAEGRPASAVPHATAVYQPRDRSIELNIAGIREDLTGNRPLQNESGEPFGKPVPIRKPPVDHLGRLVVLDDSAVAYRIQLTREARFRLMGLPDPARIVVDVEDTGGSRPPAK
jgi:hypothetical protein